MGVDNAKLLREFTGVVPEVTSTDSLDAAMTAAKAAARPGDAVVLLSPACASVLIFSKLREPRRAVQGVGKRKGKGDRSSANGNRRRAQ